MQCKELEAVLEQDDLRPLAPAAREHLAECPACQGFLADLSSIAAAAKTIPAEVAPPERVWISLRAQLQAEGLIQQESLRVAHVASAWYNFAALFRPRVLLTAGATAALALLAYLQFHKSALPIANVAAPTIHQTGEARAVEDQRNASTPVPVQPSAMAQTKSLNSPRIHPDDQPLRPSPSELAASTVLTNVEQDVPDMQLAGNSAVDASLRQNLRTVNEFIAECQQRLKQNPRDELAREYLYNAYQQKAELLSAMMESGRSEH